MDIVTYAALKKQIGQSENGTSSTADAYIVPYTYNLADGLVELPKGTYDGILQAYNEGKDIFLNMNIADPNGNESYTYKALAPLEHCEFFKEGTPDFVFCCNLNRHVYYAYINSGNTISTDVYSNPYLVNLGATVLDDDYVAKNFDYVPTIKAVNQVAKTLRKESAEAIADAAPIFYVPFNFGTNGFELDGVTHADIISAWQAGKKILGKAYVPAEANLMIAGNVELSLSYVRDDYMIAMSFINGNVSAAIFISSDNTVTVSVEELAAKGASSGSSDSCIHFIDVSLVTHYSLSGDDNYVTLPESVVHAAFEAYSAGKMVILRNDEYDDGTKQWYYPYDSIFDGEDGVIVFGALKQQSVLMEQNIYKTMILSYSDCKLTGSHMDLDSGLTD